MPKERCLKGTRRYSWVLNSANLRETIHSRGNRIVNTVYSKCE